MAVTLVADHCTVNLGQRSNPTAYGTEHVAPPTGHRPPPPRRVGLPVSKGLARPRACLGYRAPGKRRGAGGEVGGKWGATGGSTETQGHVPRVGARGCVGGGFGNGPRWPLTCGPPPTPARLCGGHGPPRWPLCTAFGPPCASAACACWSGPASYGPAKMQTVPAKPRPLPATIATANQLCNVQAPLLRQHCDTTHNLPDLSLSISKLPVVCRFPASLSYKVSLRPAPQPSQANPKTTTPSLICMGSRQATRSCASHLPSAIATLQPKPPITNTPESSNP